MLSNQRAIIDQVKLTYSALGEALEKQTKNTEDQSKRKIKAIEDPGKQLVESNEDFNIDRYSILHQEQKEILNKLIKERSSEFYHLEKTIKSKNFMYKYETEGRSPKSDRFIQKFKRW